MTDISVWVYVFDITFESKVELHPRKDKELMWNCPLRGDRITWQIFVRASRNFSSAPWELSIFKLGCSQYRSFGWTIERRRLMIWWLYYQNTSRVLAIFNVNCMYLHSINARGLNPNIQWSVNFSQLLLMETNLSTSSR